MGAAPSTGKTTFAKQLTDQVAALNPDAVCLFVSYEQSREELRVKTLSRLSGVENRDILRGRLNPQEAAWMKVRKVAEEYRESAAGRVFILEGDKATTVDRVRLAGLQVKARREPAGCSLRSITFRLYRPKKNTATPGTGLTPSSLTCAAWRANWGPRSSPCHRSGERHTTTPVCRPSRSRAGSSMPPIWAGSWSPTVSTKGATALEGGVRRDWYRVCLDIVKNRNGERSRIPFDFYPAVSRFIEDPGGPVASA